MAKAMDTARIRELLAGRSLVMVGMMGCGKTAIGRLLARELRIPYCDSDAEIVAAAGMSIPEIFEQFGEEYFRSGEQRVIARLLGGQQCVLSLGGGAFMAPETRAKVHATAVSVWLTADADLLMSRIRRRPDTRPLLKTADPRARLVELMAQRDPVYDEADLKVPSSKTSKTRTRDDVLDAVQELLEREAAIAHDL